MTPSSTSRTAGIVECRLIEHEPASGTWNMAVDEALAESSAAESRWTLRLYRWRQPTLSLGYFQASADRALHRASLACPLVRRTSGGGAILHDRELTYCLTVPTRGMNTTAIGLYRAVHGALVEALAELGVSAWLHASSAPTAPDEPFLCFERRTDGDVILDGSKIAGSAQRRRRGALLQHGSILLARSDAAPELPGIAELVVPSTRLDELLPVWLARLPAALGVRFQLGELTTAESHLASRIVREKFSRSEWNERR